MTPQLCSLRPNDGGPLSRTWRPAASAVPVFVSVTLTRARCADLTRSEVELRRRDDQPVRLRHRRRRRGWCRGRGRWSRRRRIAGRGGGGRRISSAVPVGTAVVVGATEVSGTAVVGGLVGAGSVGSGGTSGGSSGGRSGRELTVIAGRQLVCSAVAPFTAVMATNVRVAAAMVTAAIDARRAARCSCIPVHGDGNAAPDQSGDSLDFTARLRYRARPPPRTGVPTWRQARRGFVRRGRGTRRRGWPPPSSG